MFPRLGRRPPIRGRQRTLALGLIGASALLASTALEPAGAPPPAASASDRRGHTTTALEQEQTVYELVNGHRRARGLAPLALDARLSRQARVHSLAMATGTTPFGHDGFEDRAKALAHALSCRRTAENVAYDRGHHDPAAEAVRGWLRSRGHRKNIEGRYDLTGVGVASNAAGEVYFTQIFVGR